jgi:hypothetical protein
MLCFGFNCKYYGKFSVVLFWTTITTSILRNFPYPFYQCMESFGTGIGYVYFCYFRTFVWATAEMLKLIIFRFCNDRLPEENQMKYCNETGEIVDVSLVQQTWNCIPVTQFPQIIFLQLFPTQISCKVRKETKMLTRFFFFKGTVSRKSLQNLWLGM